MADFLKEVYDYLTAQAVMPAGSLFRNHTPDQPEEVMVITGTPGWPKDRDADGNIIGHPGLQVKVRTKDPDAGYAYLERAEKALELVINTSLSGSFYQFIKPSQSAGTMGWENGCLILYQNFEISRSE